MKAIQDFYPEHFAHCFGCGYANPAGLHLKSYLGDDYTWARFSIDEKFSGGVPGNAYGGMIASLLDCHGTASAAAFAYRNRGRIMDDGGPTIRFVTASLKIDFKQPTPLDRELLITGYLKSIEGRKVMVSRAPAAGGGICAPGGMFAGVVRA